MANKILLKYIKETRDKGYDDYQIRDSLVRGKWPNEEIESAFNALKPKYGNKQEITIYLDSKLVSKLEKRAEKNMLTLPEQIEDILRRSTLNQKKKTPAEEKIDDKFITFFSRKK
jgi:hypothetical protein